MQRADVTAHPHPFRFCLSPPLLSPVTALLTFPCLTVAPFSFPPAVPHPLFPYTYVLSSLHLLHRVPASFVCRRPRPKSIGALRRRPRPGPAHPYSLTPSIQGGGGAQTGASTPHARCHCSLSFHHVVRKCSEGGRRATEYVAHPHSIWRLEDCTQLDSSLRAPKATGYGAEEFLMAGPAGPGQSCSLAWKGWRGGGEGVRTKLSPSLGVQAALVSGDNMAGAAASTHALAQLPATRAGWRPMLPTPPPHMCHTPRPAVTGSVLPLGKGGIPDVVTVYPL